MKLVLYVRIYLFLAKDVINLVIAQIKNVKIMGLVLSKKGNVMIILILDHNVTKDVIRSTNIAIGVI